MLLLPLYSRVTLRTSPATTQPPQHQPCACSPMDEALGWIHGLGSQNCLHEGRAKSHQLLQESTIPPQALGSSLQGRDLSGDTDPFGQPVHYTPLTAL